MSSLSSDILINPQDLFDITVSTAGTQLGALATTGDGRYYRYALAGASALVVGKVQQSAVEATGNEALAIAAAAVGATQIVTTSTVTVTANQYQGGYVAITQTPGLGYLYQIAGHAAVTSAVLTINLVDPIIVALTTATQIDLVSNKYASVIINPVSGSATGTVAGVAVAATPATDYGWLQVRGIANVLADDAITVGTAVQTSDTVAGAVTNGNVSAGVYPCVGIAVTGIADTDYGAVDLNIS